MTYDDADEIRQLARKHGFDTRLVAMKNTHNATKSELLIGNDLSWFAYGVQQNTRREMVGT
jgi:DNA adenine methylase